MHVRVFALADRLHHFADVDSVFDDGIAHRHALRVAVVSAAGRISFGLCADADAVDGVDLIAQGIEREVWALCAAAA